ncbi:MAG: Holliday junction branch migration protein RuvA [Oscillospiraceae bacterium]|jgi:Holliday junction DNA helicase RuvA|nr:Holliday junction branch migration protein RuvA [Oscillospiraceae bacterium]
MFYSLRGILSHIDTNFVVIECSGVGYRVFVTQSTIKSLPQLGEQVFLYTYMNVRENSLELFGFEKKNEYFCFKLLISVSGVGPKLGLGIVSELGARPVAIAVAKGDSKTLTKASGVGAKLAGRIILELKDKLSDNKAATQYELEKTGTLSDASNASLAVNALAVLGFSTSEAVTAVAKFDSSLPTEELIRLALKVISSG